MSNSNFGHNVFKSRLLLMHQNVSGKGLKSATTDVLYQEKVGFSNWCLRMIVRLDVHLEGVFGVPRFSMLDNCNTSMSIFT